MNNDFSLNDSLVAQLIQKFEFRTALEVRPFEAVLGQGLKNFDSFLDRYVFYDSATIASQ